MTGVIDKLVAQIAAAASSSDDEAARQAAIADLRRKRPTTRERLELHRDLHRAARNHLAAVDKHNATNPTKPMEYQPRMLAYLKQFAYVEMDT